MSMETEAGQQDVAPPDAGRLTREEIEQILAETERSFRRSGLPAITLGYDRSYRTKVIWAVLLVNVTFVALSLLSFLMDFPRLFAFFLPLQVLTILGAGILAAMPTDPYAKRLVPAQQAGSWLTRALILKVLLLIAAAVLWSMAPAWDWLDVVMYALLGALVGSLVLSMLGGACVLLMHVGRSVFGGLGPSLRDAVKEMPLLIPALLIVFVADDAWRLFGQLTGWRYALLLLAFLLTSVAVLHGHIGSARRSLYETAEAAHPEHLGKETPVRDLMAQVTPSETQLSRAEKFNIKTVLAAVAALRLALVGLATALALFLFGLLLVNRSATASLLERNDVRALAEFDFLGSEVFVTAELIQLSLALGAFAALYFAVTMCEAGSRKGKVPDFMVAERASLAEALAARPYYLAAHDELAAERAARYTMTDDVTG
jgi:hypothetical protein